MTGHKYKELAQQLRAKIQTGEYVVGQRMPSENELAVLTGYSRQTVRQAIGMLEREGLTSRVRGSGTYVRSSAPRREATHNVAVVTTYIGEYIFPAILQGIETVLTQNSYTPLLFATRNRVDNERRVLTELMKKPIDGMLVEGTKTALPNPNLDLYEQLQAMGIPVVFLNGFSPDLKRPVYVVADDRAGGHMACTVLLEKGHRHIAGIFKSDDIQGHRRYAGYAQALCAAGIAVDDDCVIWYTTENRDSLLSACAAAALAGCTGVVCYNDEVALRVRKLMKERGVPPAQQPEIVSFDNSTFARLCPVPFLSLSNPKERMGRLAAEKLVHMLNGQPEQAVLLPWGRADSEIG